MLQDIPTPTLREASPCILETERLRLRRPTLADVKAIARLANDRRIAENTRRLPHPYSQDHAIEFVRGTANEHRGTVFLIETNHTPIGMVGVDWREPDAPELGWRNPFIERTLKRRRIFDSVDAMYSMGDENKFLEVTYQNGDKETLYFKDFASGAMIENIVRRAKKLSIKRTIAGGERGICTDDLLDSIKQEFREHEDLPNTTNPDDWAKISGKKGERIVYVRTIVNEGDKDQGGRQIERVTTGQYL